MSAAHVECNLLIKRSSQRNQYGLVIDSLGVFSVIRPIKFCFLVIWFQIIEKYLLDVSMIHRSHGARFQCTYPRPLNYINIHGNKITALHVTSCFLVQNNITITLYSENYINWCFQNLKFIDGNYIRLNRIEPDVFLLYWAFKFQDDIAGCRQRAIQSSYYFSFAGSFFTNIVSLHTWWCPSDNGIASYIGGQFYVVRHFQ